MIAVFISIQFREIQNVELLLKGKKELLSIFLKG